jgi:hypothetical protein
MSVTRHSETWKAKAGFDRIHYYIQNGDSLLLGMRASIQRSRFSGIFVSPETANSRTFRIKFVNTKYGLSATMKKDMIEVRPIKFGDMKNDSGMNPNEFEMIYNWDFTDIPNIGYREYHNPDSTKKFVTEMKHVQGLAVSGKLAEMESSAEESQIRINKLKAEKEIMENKLNKIKEEREKLEKSKTNDMLKKRYSMVSLHREPIPRLNSAKIVPEESVKRYVIRGNQSARDGKPKWI